MQTETVAISDLRPPKKNVRLHPERELIELGRSVDMFGQIRPLVIDENNTILVGNGLAAAMARIGRTTAIAYRVNHLSEHDKTRLMLADNRIYALGLDDNAAILDVIRGLDDPYKFDIPGFDPDVLKDLIGDLQQTTSDAIDHYGKLTAEAVQEAQAEGEAQEQELRGRRRGARNQDVPEAIVCPHCGEAFYRDGA